MTSNSPSLLSPLPFVSQREHPPGPATALQLPHAFPMPRTLDNRRPLKQVFCNWLDTTELENSRLRLAQGTRPQSSFWRRACCVCDVQRYITRGVDDEARADATAATTISRYAWWRKARIGPKTAPVALATRTASSQKSASCRASRARYAAGAFVFTASRRSTSCRIGGASRFES